MLTKHGTSVLLALALVLNLAMVPALQAAQAPVVPRDTVLKLVLNDSLSTKDTKVGDRFTATLAEDVVVDGRTMLRRGATVQGTVTQVERPKRMAGMTGKASLMLRFDRIQTPDGSRPIAATVVSVHDPVAVNAKDEKKDSKVGNEGQVQAKNDTKDMITKGAIGVAAGALLGAVFGNVSRGVILGSIGGAVAILAPKGKDITLPKGTGLEVRLDRDVNLAIS